MTRMASAASWTWCQWTPHRLLQGPRRTHYRQKGGHLRAVSSSMSGVINQQLSLGKRIIAAPNVHLHTTGVLARAVIISCESRRHVAWRTSAERACPRPGTAVVLASRHPLMSSELIFLNVWEQRHNNAPLHSKLCLSAIIASVSSRHLLRGLVLVETFDPLGSLHHVDYTAAAVVARHLHTCLGIQHSTSSDCRVGCFCGLRQPKSLVSAPVNATRAD